MSVRFWKYLAIFLFAALVGVVAYMEVGARIEAGYQGAIYLSNCVQSGLCPSAEAITTALKSKKP